MWMGLLKWIMQAGTGRPYDRLMGNYPVGACIARPLTPNPWTWRDMVVFSKCAVPNTRQAAPATLFAKEG